MTKHFYYVCKVDENNWEVCYDNGFGETVEGKFTTEQEAKGAAKELNEYVTYVPAMPNLCREKS